MRRSLKAALSAVVVVAPLALVATQFGASAAAPTAHHYPPHNATTKIAGLQHWCGSNGITCAEPAIDVGRGAWLQGGHQGRRAHRGLHRPRRAGHAVLLEHAGLGQRCHLPDDAAQGPADAAQEQRQRRNRQLPAAPDLLARHGDVRQPGFPEPGRSGAHRPRDGALQAGQQLQHLREPESHELALLRPRPGPGLRGDAVLPARLGAVAGRHRLHRHAVVHRDEHRHVLGEPEHRPVRQHRVPEHRGPGAGELRVPHQERQRRRPRTRGLRSTLCRTTRSTC